MLIVKNLYKDYAKKRVLSNFSYTFEEDKTYALMGPSGCGKTTLLKILAGLDDQYRGRMFYNSNEILKQKRIIRHYIRDCAAYSPQFPVFFENVSGYQNLAIALPTKINFPQHEFLHVSLQKKVQVLSGGERKRINLLLHIKRRKPILLLDEPTSSLDEDNQQALMNYIIKNHQGILIFSTHNQAFAKAYADEIIYL